MKKYIYQKFLLHCEYDHMDLLDMMETLITFLSMVKVIACLM